jgi:hypothetical protein
MTATPPFPLGQVVATKGALAALKNADQSALDFLARHARGDWGEVGEEDTHENALSLCEGHRLMSVYTLQGGQKALDHHRGRPQRHHAAAAPGILKPTTT